MEPIAKGSLQVLPGKSKYLHNYFFFNVNIWQVLLVAWKPLYLFVGFIEVGYFQRELSVSYYNSYKDCEWIAGILNIVIALFFFLIMVYFVAFRLLYQLYHLDLYWFRTSSNMFYMRLCLQNYFWPSAYWHTMGIHRFLFAFKHIHWQEILSTNSDFKHISVSTIVLSVQISFMRLIYQAIRCLFIGTSGKLAKGSCNQQYETI